MNIERLKQISLVEGFLEDYLERGLDYIKSEESDRVEKALVAWQVLSLGLRDLRLENLELREKLESIKSSLA